MVICLERGADLHMAQLMLVSLTVFCFSKIQIGSIPFWYRLTRVVPKRRAVKRVSVCVRVCVCVHTGEPCKMAKPMETLL